MIFITFSCKDFVAISWNMSKPNIYYVNILNRISLRGWPSTTSWHCTQSFFLYKNVQKNCCLQFLQMLLNFLTCHMFDQLFDEFFKEIVVPSSSHKECKRFFVTNECKIVHIASKFRSMKMIFKGCIIGLPFMHILQILNVNCEYIPHIVTYSGVNI